MEHVELFLLGGSYVTVDEGVALELYGRSRSGEAVVARYYGFRPYFDLLEPPAASLEKLSHDPEVLEVHPIRLWVGGSEHDAARVTIRYPYKVPEYRERYRQPGVEDSVLACDIPFFQRFLYDKALGLCVQFDAEPEPPEVAAKYTVPKVLRVVVGDGRDIRAGEAFRPALTVLSFDIENAIRERTIYTICGVVHGADGGRRSFRLSDPDERKILRAFAEEVREADPDVLTGYNIGGYDVPLLQERAETLKIGELSLGRDGGPVREAGERLWRLSGRVVADA